MNKYFYLERTLIAQNSGHVFTERELLENFRYIVVLAEPGAGKTELMASLARKLSVRPLSASVLMYNDATSADNGPLVVDAVDEIATIEKSGIYRLLGAVYKLKPTLVIMSSRSSEWEQASTTAFEQFLGSTPEIVRLNEFSSDEQRQLFENYTGSADFGSFQEEIYRFNLGMLLPNPQFLKLFSDAYFESNKHFTDKKSIFSMAVERLAKEANSRILKVSNTLQISKKISLSSEVFTKLLLSGAEGVNTSEATENRLYPALSSLVDDDNVHKVLSTRLFMPGADENQHRPVHKIVAEYCAASYLVSRIATLEKPLKLSECLSLIAPNGVSRDELRGLLGWMATLGNKIIQETIIDLDAYAVLANGDPSQLESSSKRQLIHKLKQLEDTDPYFRRGDYFRRFSVSDFFTPDILDEIKSILINHKDGHLHDLLLDLLVDSPIASDLVTELTQVVVSDSETEYTRMSALACLVNTKDYNLFDIFGILIFESSNISLSMISTIIEKIGVYKVGFKNICGYLRVCAHLYPDHKTRYDGELGTRYFIRRLISLFPADFLEILLNELTAKLACVCGSESYNCDCRNGISKIIGMVMDRYFELIPAPYDPIQIWSWVKNLHYHERILTKDSKAVHVLQTDTALRQGILTHVFSEITDQKEIWNLKVHYFSSGFQSHSGLIILKDDILFILSMAFDINNAELWRGFIVSHPLYKNDDLNEVKFIRHMLRQQALVKPEFMRHWAFFNKVFKSGKVDSFKCDIKFKRKRKRYEKRKNEINRRGIEFINNNLPLIASGRHLGCLERFSELILFYPEKIKEEVGNEKLITQALTNCIDYISSITPTLQEIAKLRCASKRSSLELIWFAACLVILRNQGSLDSVPVNILFALQSTFNFRYKPVSKEEYEKLKKEVADILFIGCDSKIQFICNYIEPQLSERFEHTNVEILQSYDVFSELHGDLSIKWLLEFKGLPINLVDRIFEIAVNHGCRDQLKEIIRQYVYDSEQKWIKKSTDEQVKSELYFWILREFCFIEKTHESHWEFFTEDKDNLLLLHHKSGRINQNEFQGWPKLTSDKVEKVLDAFYEQWPVVELPSSWGTDSPKGEIAYRFLTDLIWNINSDNPDNAIPVLVRLLNDKRFLNSRSELQSILASQRRKKLLLDFKPPSVREVVSYLDKNEVISVEGIRKVVLQELTNFQKSIDGGEFNSADRFYENGVRLDEVKSTEIIAERLSLKLEHKNITVTLEHQLKSHNRSDFTASGIVNGRKRLLVTEVKGQWHRELYTAAEKQLYERYSIHPAAEQQGIFLVLWFGKNEKVAGKIHHKIKTATELKIKIESELPYELRGLIDIFVLDISKEI